MKIVMGYERDPYQREMEVRISSGEKVPSGYRVMLDDTILYPEGGGQPSDRGWLGGVAVMQVEKTARGPVHVLERPVEPGPAMLLLDWERRYDHMQQHTAQHLLTREALNRYGWATRSFHIGPRVSDIELDCQPPEEREIEALEDGVARRVCEARPIRGFRVDPEELSALEVRSRGLPAGHTGTIRLIEIEGFDLNTCGGTHVASTAEVETFKIVTSEPLRGGCRLFWVAGKRVRRRLATEVTRLAELRSLLDCGDEDLAAGVQLKLDQLRELNRHCRRLEKRFAEARALELARSGEIVVDLHLDASDASLLRPLADCLINVASDKIALLTSETEGQPLFAVVIGGDHDLEVIEIGKAVSEILGGRGGGASRIFQGKASSLAERSQALSYLRRLTD